MATTTQSRTLAQCAVLAVSLLVSGCSDDTAPVDTPDPPGPDQIQVQVVYDPTSVAFRFAWMSRPKLLPAGTAIQSQVYPGQFHDLLQHNGTRFDRLPAGTRIDEDRVSFILGTAADAASGFEETGCWSSCHTGMANHRRSSPGIYDHWHWRGGRSGPMGYAEDAGVDATARIRDALGTPPSAWLRSAGDRLREDQAALSGTGHPLAEGMPRFVFRKGKVMPGGFEIPAYFLAGMDGAVLRDPYLELPVIKDVSVNRSLLVAFQDQTFDPVDKVNSVDMGYLVYVARGTTGHLPAHLQVTTSPTFSNWTAYWSAQLGLQPDPTSAAESILTAVNAEWEASERKAMITRSIGFIYPSSQHDITSTREYDTATGEWIVTLFRRLNTGNPEDVNLASLPDGVNFPLGFAMHDAGGGAQSHDVSFPFLVGSTTAADIRAVSVSNVRSADWSNVPALGTRWIAKPNLWTLDQLRDQSLHAGAGFVGVVRCQSCHGTDTKRID